MPGFLEWPIEADADDLRNAILLCIEIGLEETNPTLQLLRRKLRAELRLEVTGLPRHLTKGRVCHERNQNPE